MEAIVHDILAQGFGTLSENKFAEGMWVKPRVPEMESEHHEFTEQLAPDDIPRALLQSTGIVFVCELQHRARWKAPHTRLCVVYSK